MSNRSAHPYPAPEPDPFDEAEFAAWRGFLRVHTSVTRELDRRMSERHELPLDAYGVLITLVTAPTGALTLKELGARRNLTASGITRSVDRLAKAGLVERRPNPGDGRSAFVALTPVGLRRLREAQVTHHATVRELLLGRLSRADLKLLGALWEKAMPGRGQQSAVAAGGRRGRVGFATAMAITVYEKRTCTTCRNLAELLAERGIDFDTVEYHVEGLTEPEVRALLAKAGIPASAALRMREEGAAELAAAGDEDAIVAAMVERPELLQRPIVVNGDRAVLARPVERVLEIL